MDRTRKLLTTLGRWARAVSDIGTLTPAALAVLLFANVLGAQNLPDAPSAVFAQQIHRELSNCDAPPQSSESVDGEGRKNSSTADKSQSDNNSEPHQTKRMLWVVPNFAAVSAGAKFAPLSARQKFALASDDSFDYSAFVWTAILTAQSYALNSDPELGRGFAGYMRYYWRAFADGVSGTFFTEAIVPSLTHEDPRYFTLGHGGFLRRFGYSLSRTVITKTDSGGTTFNWSEVGGNALEASLSNAYYPPQEVGLHQTMRDWGDQMESAALNNIAKEFWPDIRRDIFRQK